MVIPLPAQPDAAASQNQTRPRPKPAGSKKIQHRAIDWASAVHIPTHYPDGTRVYDPARVKATLHQLARWCNSNDGFDPRPIINDFTDRDGDPQKGILNALQVNINSYRKCLSALGRLGFISTKIGGNQNRRTQYTLHVNKLQTEYQERLPNPAFRTDFTEHEQAPMPSEHGRTPAPMPSGHGRTPAPMPSEHGRTDLSLYNLSKRHDVSRSGSAPLSTTVADGGGASSFCSDFLIPSLEDEGLHGFSPVSLSFFDSAAADFTSTHGRPPDRAVADHVAKRLVGFIRDKGIDVSSEPHRVFGYLRSQQVLPLVPIEESVTLSFAPPKPSSEHPEPPAPPPPEVKLDPEAEAIWARALDRLREKVARAAYETWLVDTVGVTCEGGVFIVGVSNSFVSEMLKLQVHSHIEATVQECAGDESLTVQFAVIAMPDRREAR